MVGVIEDLQGMIHEVALRVHIDEAGDGEWGIKEAILEQIGMDLFSFGKISVASTFLEGGNASSEIVGRMEEKRV